MGYYPREDYLPNELDPTRAIEASEHLSKNIGYNADLIVDALDKNTESANRLAWATFALAGVGLLATIVFGLLPFVLPLFGDQKSDTTETEIAREIGTNPRITSPTE